MPPSVGSGHASTSFAFLRARRRVSLVGGGRRFMPIHKWKRVDAGIYHDFHHAWIEELKRALNRGVLPEDYYALAEQFAAGYGPDVFTLQEGTSVSSPTNGPALGVLQPKPAVRF